MSYSIIYFAGVFFCNSVGKPLLIYGYINTHSRCEQNQWNDVIYLHSLQENFFPVLAKALPRKLESGGSVVRWGGTEDGREGQMNSRMNAHFKTFRSKGCQLDFMWIYLLTVVTHFLKSIENTSVGVLMCQALDYRSRKWQVNMLVLELVWVLAPSSPCHDGQDNRGYFLIPKAWVDALSDYSFHGIWVKTVW